MKGISTRENSKKIYKQNQKKEVDMKNADLGRFRDSHCEKWSEFANWGFMEVK